MTSLSSLAGRRRPLRMLRRPSEPIRPATPRPARRDCSGRLCAALAALAGEGAEAVRETFRPWQSATFIGTQHGVTLRLAGPDAFARAEALAAALPDAEFRLPGHVVIDVAIDGLTRDRDEGAQLALCVLTIEDW